VTQPHLLPTRDAAASDLETTMNHATKYDRAEANTMASVRHPNLKNGGAALTLLALLGAAFAGCGDNQPPINQVQTNVIEKSMLAGSWYMTEQTIDFDYEAAGLGFVGEVSQDGTGGGMARIRWVIDEDYLYAYRDYLATEDAQNPMQAQDSSFLGQPIAAYTIESHFDIRRTYNTTTGEEQNTIVENTTDNRWWDRRFMRVDFQRNLIASWYGTSNDLSELFGQVVREPADVMIQANSNFPAEWRPQFLHMGCATPTDTHCSIGDQLYASDYQHNDLYSMSFVTQQLLSPGFVTYPGYGTFPYCGEANQGLPECASVVVAVRTSFLRVSPTRQYDAMQFTDDLFNRAGYFRLERNTYDHSVAVTSGPNQHTDAGDIAWGDTDFRNYAAMRFNLWHQWRNADGSAIPYAQRTVRPIHWFTSREVPGHLIMPAFQSVSEWNSVLMGIIRQRQGTHPLPQYPRVTCQHDDPAGYCFCQQDPNNAMVNLNPTCPGRYDPFNRPTDALPNADPADPVGTHVVNPYDCWVGFGAAGAEQSLYQLMSDMDPGNDPEPNWNNPGVTRESFDRWFGAHMIGTECADILSVNGCNLSAVTANGGNTDGLDCQERGDIRYSLLSFVDQPGTPFLGVAQFRADPVSGEMFGADANIGGPALNTYRTRALQQYDLINGRLSDQEFFTGEDVRAYLEATNHVDLPAPPRIDFSVAGMSGYTPINGEGVMSELTGRMDQAMVRAEQLRGPQGRAAIYEDRLHTLAGTDIEERLLDNDEGFVLAGMNMRPDGTVGSLGSDFMALASPFRGDLARVIEDNHQSNYRISAAGMHMPNAFIDDSVMWYVNQSRLARWTRAHVEFDIDRRLYRQTEVHEMGHCHGLRHDYGGSADTDNYPADYYRIATQYPLPDPNNFDTDHVVGLNLTEQAAYEAAYSTARRNRILSGINAWMSSSVMDYTGAWYERITGSASHDWMAIGLGYGGLVDIYHNSASLPLAQVNPATTERVYATYYVGGGSCTTDADCAYSTSGSRMTDLTDANMGSGLTQHCVQNPNVVAQHVCSNFDDDASALVAGFQPNATPAWIPVSYRYCEDYRGVLRTLPWCNQFDEGDSFREMVRNAQEAYDRSYIFAAFRRYRRTFDIGAYIQNLLRYWMPLVNIEQNLVYRYQSDPAFRSQTGAWGFQDEFLATADTLNYFARVLSSPAVGTYTYNTGYGRYMRCPPGANCSNDPNAPGNLHIDLGQGRFYYSIYQSGLTGINRIERIGVFIDKIITMQLMTLRGLSPFYGPDAVFYTNLYDLFPSEINQLFTGMMGDQPEQYMPRVTCSPMSVFPACTDPHLVYMNIYRGDCRHNATPGQCIPDPVATTYNPATNPGLYIADGGAGVLLQGYAAIYGLSQFPVYYDTTFEQQAFICIEGEGDCHATTGTAGVNYVRYTSTRLDQSYLAWQVDPNLSQLTQHSIGFEMVQEASNDDTIYRALQVYRGDFGGPGYSMANFTGAYAALPGELAAIHYTIPAQTAQVDTEITRLYDRITSLESFFNYLIQLERQFGIQFPFLYNRPEL
jgi:hypothetical protein